MNSVAIEQLEAGQNVMRKCVGFRPMHVTATKWQFIASGDCRFKHNFISNSVAVDAATLTDCISMCVTSTNGRLRASSFVEMIISH